jgi:hypothetical protein
MHRLAGPRVGRGPGAQGTRGTKSCAPDGGAGRCKNAGRSGGVQIRVGVVHVRAQTRLGVTSTPEIYDIAHLLAPGSTERQVYIYSN